MPTSLDKQYAITYDIVFDNRIRTAINEAVSTLISLSDVVDKRLPEALTINVAGADVIIKPLKKTTIPGLGAVATSLRGSFEDNFLGEESALVQKVRNTFDQIHQNVISRFKSSGINSITGELASAVENQEPDVIVTKTRIFAGFGNISELDAGTPTKRSAAVKKAKRRQRNRSATYPYSLPGGRETRVRGYWAFQDQCWIQASTEAEVPGAQFMLDWGELHTEDMALINGIESFIKSQVSVMNAEIRSLLR